LAFRAFFGIGKAYANSEYLPFEKGFFAGGANGMRGWVLKLMGPGAYANANNSNYDRMGDLQIEANFEYRFPLYSVLKGALFADLGNIWLLKDNALYPQGVFQSETFIKELGFDAGLGLRFDFTYFVFRLDAALRMRDPGEAESDRWVIKKAKLGSVVWNFGIGYPF
jgi:outer membrane protein assembly factor BamA